jgi:hypothetical protein
VTHLGTKFFFLAIQVFELEVRGEFYGDIATAEGGDADSTGIWGDACWTDL